MKKKKPRVFETPFMEFRKKFGMTQNDLARCLGVTRTNLNLMENKKRAYALKMIDPLSKLLILGQNIDVAEEKAKEEKYCLAMKNHDYELELEYQCAGLEKEVKYLDELEQQYYNLKKVKELAKDQISDMWRVKIQDRLKKMEKELGIEKDIKKLTLEHFKQEKERIAALKKQKEGRA